MATKGAQRAGARPGGSPPPSIPNDRLVFLLLALVGSKVVATVKGGQRFSGILSAATADGEVNLALRQAQLVDQPDSPLRPSLLIQAKDLQELQAVDISLDSRPSERDAFKTDTEVTGLASDRKEKELQAWGAGADYGGGGIEDGGLGGLDDEQQRGQGGAKAWDQFATNERLYGTRTDYHEELYTTKLDRSGADYRQREQRAAQLEREILKGGGGALANNAHIAEERGVVDDSGLTEEDRYSGVIRGSGAYVPPGARKTPLSRSAANGSSTTNGSSSSPSPSPAPAPTAQSLAASAASAQLQDPSIISVTSRLPVSSSTSRIPAAVQGSTAAVAAAGADGKPAAPTVEGSFRQFVSSERQRLMEKKNALAKAAERQDKDSKLASLLEFSQTFKLKSPMPADIAEIAGHGERKPIPTSTTTKPTTFLTPTANAPSTSASTSVSPVVSPVRVARALTPASGAAPAAPATSASGAKQPPRFTGTSTLIAEIPPFNPNRAKAKAAEAAAAAAAGKGAAPAMSKTPSSGAGAPAASASPSLSASTASKINPNAPAFVFRPNPNASSFTPGFTPRKPAEPQGPVNPFFGTKQIKKGSSSMHVKEDFTPFKTGMVNEPVTILPNWSFTGKPYRSMYPHGPSPTPPPMGMPPGAGGPDDIGGGPGGDLSGSLPMHHGAPPPPPPQGYGGAMGVYGGGGFGPQGGFNPRFAPPQQPPMQHLPPGAMNGNMQFPPPPPPQHFAPPPPPNMGYGGAPPGPPMFNSPQMQPQPGAYMRYTPFPPGGPGGPGGPPQQGGQ